MVGCRIKACRLIRLPLIAYTGRRSIISPIFNRLFVVAQDVNNGGVLHKDGLEGWRVTRNMVSKSLNIPGAQEPTKVFFQVGGEDPRSSKSTNSGSRLSLPPADGCVDCLKCQGPKGFLDVLSQATKSITHREPPFIGAEEPGSLKSRE